MTVYDVLFYVIAAFILGTGILSVTTRHIFRSAIWLLFALIGIAGLYFLLDMNFIAAVQIVVYVGGIVVLIIFSIFLTQQSDKLMPATPIKRIIFSLLAVVFGAGMLCAVLLKHPFGSNSLTAFDPSVSRIGLQLLSTSGYGYIFPFEIVSVLLLAAMIGCIVIALKSHPEHN